MTCPIQRIGLAQCNSYAINIDRGRNCYACRGFEHLARNCKNRGIGNRIGESKRLEYGQRKIIEGGNRQNDNLNGDRDLIVLN